MLRHLALGLALIGAGCLDLGGKGDTGDDDAGAAYCEAGEIQIPAGTGTLCSDGCNSCGCEGQDAYSSTLMDCEGTPPPAGCVAGIFVVDYGTTWTSADGAGACTCQEDGSFSCTSAR